MTQDRKASPPDGRAPQLYDEQLQRLQQEKELMNAQKAPRQLEEVE